MIYVRDEDDGALWGPTALPIREETGPYVARHGQGYSRFEHTSHGIALELLQYVPLDDPIKISRLTIQQSLGPHAAPLGHRLRRVGARPPRAAPSAPFVVTEIDRGDRRDARAQPLEHRASATASRSRTSAGRQTRLDRRPDGVPRPQRHARPPGRAARRRAALRTGSAPASTPAARCRPGSSSSRTARPRSSSSSARRRRRTEARALVDALPRRPTSTRSSRAVTEHWDDVLGTVQVTTPDRVHGPPAEPLAALPDARLPGLGALGLLPGERRLRLPRPAPGRDGARASRARS